jgi:hypothetical protein
MSMHPIVDKGEVAIDFPDKYYSGGLTATVASRREPIDTVHRAPLLAAARSFAAALERRRQEASRG